MVNLVSRLRADQQPQHEPLDEVWGEVSRRVALARPRPSFRFDPTFYHDENPDVSQAGMEPAEHYRLHGEAEGRPANLYQRMKPSVSDLDERVSSIVMDPQLRQLLDDNVPGAPELAFELISLGGPVDELVSDFSRAFYNASYPDIREAGVSPFRHYMRYGIAENRANLSDVRKACHRGRVAYDPDKPTCLLAVHQFSKTGAPIVGLNLAIEAAQTHNVLVTALEDGALRDAFLDVCCLAVIDRQPGPALEFMPGIPLRDIDFAVLNSAESHPLIPFLVDRSIPFAAYIHEYAYYTLPRVRTRLSLFADQLVFSSDQVRRTWASGFADLGVDLELETAVIPQAELRLKPISAGDYTHARARLSELIGRDVTGHRVIFGAAQAHWRKGTGLFLQTAQLARKRDPSTLFVWVGDGVNHEDIQFGIWVDHHAQSLGVNNPDGNLFMLPSGEHYHDVCKAADALYLASRLDPLPNVVFDAASNGCQIVLFLGATGFDDPAYEDARGLRFVDYCDVEAAADVLVTIEQKADRVSPEPAAALDAGETEALSGDVFARISESLTGRIAAVGRANGQLSGDYDVSILFPDRNAQADARSRERSNLWHKGRRFVWRSPQEVQEALRGSANWVHQHCDVTEARAVNPAESTVADDYSLHIHMERYDAVIQHLIEYATVRHASHLVITTPNQADVGDVSELMAEAEIDAEIHVVERRGRNLLPLLNLLNERAAGEIWCHLHTGLLLGQLGNVGHDQPIWRQFLLRGLLGDESAITTVPQLLQDPNVGLAAPLDPFLWGWGGARRCLDQAAGWFAKPLPEHPLVYAAASMLWVKPGVVDQLRARLDDHYLWPGDPLPNEGSVYDVVERTWSAFAAAGDYRSIYLSQPDQRRC